MQIISRRPEEENEIAASFQQSIKSLRKNDGMMLMADKTGNVQRRQRPGVIEDTLLDEPPLPPPGPSFRSPNIGPQVTPYVSHRSDEPADEPHVGSVHEFME